MLLLPGSQDAGYLLLLVGRWGRARAGKEGFVLLAVVLALEVVADLGQFVEGLFGRFALPGVVLGNAAPEEPIGRGGGRFIGGFDLLDEVRTADNGKEVDIAFGLEACRKLGEIFLTALEGVEIGREVVLERVSQKAEVEDVWLCEVDVRTAGFFQYLVKVPAENGALPAKPFLERGGGRAASFEDCQGGSHIVVGQVVEDVIHIGIIYEAGAGQKAVDAAAPDGRFLPFFLTNCNSLFRVHIARDKQENEPAKTDQKAAVLGQNEHPGHSRQQQAAGDDLRPPAVVLFKFEGIIKDEDSVDGSGGKEDVADGHGNWVIG